MSADDRTILGDWGSTRLRLALSHGDERLWNVEAPGLFAATEPPAEILRHAIARLPEAESANRIVLCGMAGAREGLREVAYLPVPAGQPAWRSAAASSEFDGRQLTIMPGLSDEGYRPDVMRGEETQLFGLLALEPELSDAALLAILPGTHSKWATLEGGIITGFRTFVTGELLSRLHGSSLAGERDEFDETGFAEGIERARSGSLEAGLFEARAARLLRDRSAGWSSGYLSGLLIGREIIAGLERFDAREVVVIGEPDLARRYAAALERFEVESRICNGDKCVLAGLESVLAESR